MCSDRDIIEFSTKGGSGAGGSNGAMASAGRAPRFGLWRVAFSLAALLVCRAPGEFGRSNWDHPALFNIPVSAVVRTANNLARMRLARGRKRTPLECRLSSPCLSGAAVGTSVLSRSASVRQGPPVRKAPCECTAGLRGCRSFLAQPGPSIRGYFFFYTVG